MTDQELLEKAAKAAGIRIDKSPYNGGGANNTGFDMLGNAVLDWHNDITWNPLKDDGDALRLAIQCQLDLSLGLGGGQAIIRDGITFDEVDSIDPFAATRRVIVKAAAAMANVSHETLTTPGENY